MSATLTPIGFSPSPSFRIPTVQSRSSQILAHAGGATASRAKNLYEVLRVKETASAEDIKASYRALAKRFHPDVDPNGGSEFVEIHGAYATLSDPVARARYNQTIGRIGFYAEPRLRSRRWETDQCW